ncbi:MAG: DUF1570 domain-containing protein, partial [Planctomycetales bacterium]|nr:DUF1570 domain-containing protein [Planctomycetales bacterium]
DQPFELLGKQQLSDKLLSEVPVGFQIYETPHYIICYNTSKAYAQWCGGLFERLYRGFHNYWQRRGIELEPTPPMVALVFQDQASFAEYSKPELKDAVNSIIGYYSLATNRITMYDLTGVDELRQAGGSRGSLRHIRQILSRPEAERTVATIVHEATHQLVFNTGMQQRFADIPVWLNEGLAMYFESPDNSSRGWRSIGSINETRLSQMQRYLGERPDHSLVTLLNSDGRFRDARTAEAAYAESWSLVYHLLRTNSDGFVQYMKTMKQKPPLGQDSPAQRLQEFRDAFGELDHVDEEMVQLIQSL